MNPTKYFIIARVFPALITIVPIAVLYYFYLNTYLSDFLHAIIFAKFIGEVTIFSSLIYLYAQFNRLFGKLIEDRVFADEAKIPTTELLLYSNRRYSSEYRNNINNKVKNDFHLSFLSQADEFKNISEARRRILEIIGLIRNKTRKSELLLQHNYEYGFVRNLVGGSPLGLLISLIDAFIFTKASPNLTSLTISLVFAVFFSFLIIFGVRLIRYMGSKYAKVLIQEYLSQ